MPIPDIPSLLEYICCVYPLSTVRDPKLVSTVYTRLAYILTEKCIIVFLYTFLYRFLLQGSMFEFEGVVTSAFASYGIINDEIYFDYQVN